MGVFFISGTRNELQEQRKMCCDWEKAPVELSIVEKRVPDGPPKNTRMGVFFISGTRNELQEQRRMCCDWEKAPVELSIVEKRVPDGPPKKSSNPKGYCFYIIYYYIKSIEAAMIYCAA